MQPNAAEVLKMIPSRRPVCHNVTMTRHHVLYRRLKATAGAAAAMIALSLFVSTTAVSQETAPNNNRCVTWKTEAPFVGLAYNHLVHLKNTCTYAVSCRVKTDVNPKEETVLLEPKEHKTQLTFRGSPARTFKATVTCTQK